jgi:hypothetical protein
MWVRRVLHRSGDDGKKNPCYPQCIMEVGEKRIKFAKEFTLVPLGDIHFGSPACDEEAARKARDYILNTPDAYCIGMGDYADLILMQDVKRFTGSAIKGDLLDELDSAINRQRDMVVRYFKPLADKGKLLGLLTGNHEEAMTKHHSFNFMRDVCDKLNVPSLGYSCFYRLRLEKEKNNTVNTLTIYAHHGFGGGRKPGASINRQVDAITSYDADIVLSGHDHQVMGKRFVRLGIVGNPPKVIAKTIILGKTGSFLKTAIPRHTSYSEKAGYPPNHMGHITIKASLIMSRTAHNQLELHVTE